MDEDVPRAASYGVYISQLIRFPRVFSHVNDFNTRNKLLTAKLLNQGYRYHKLRKAFSKFYRRHSDLVSKFNVRLKSLLQQGLSEPEFYGDLAFMRTEFLCIYVLRVVSGPRVKLASCKSALNPPPPPPVVCSTDRSKAVV